MEKRFQSIHYIFILSLLVIEFLYGVELEILSLHYECEIKTNSIEKNTGKIVIEKSGLITIQTYSPVPQYAFIRDNEFTTYFKGESEANQIQSKSPITIPYIGEALMCTKEDYGLSDLGYSIESADTIDDTLKVTWAPPKEKLPLMQLFLIDDKIVKILVLQDDVLLKKTICQDYVIIDGVYFPAFTQEFFDNTVKTCKFDSVKINDNDIQVPFKLSSKIKVIKHKW